MRDLFYEEYDQVPESCCRVAMSDYTVANTHYWEVPDEPTSKHIDDPNNPDCHEE